ncbi:hypothetical protein Tco_1498750 [Tanacetum coccineum]
MAKLQRQVDVHQDGLCPPNKCYGLMDAKKKIDLDNPLCPTESKIMENILQKQNNGKHSPKTSTQIQHCCFIISTIDLLGLTLTLNDFIRIFQLPQVSDNNHERFVAAPKFSEMVPFFLKDLGFTLELRSPSNFKTTGLV